MTIKELKELLDTYPEETEVRVLTSRQKIFNLVVEQSELKEENIWYNDVGKYLELGE